MTDMSRRHITAREAQDCLGIPMSTIRGWAKDEKRLAPVSIDANGERWYRLADVLELAATTRRRKPHCRPNRRRRDITRTDGQESVRSAEAKRTGPQIRQREYSAQSSQ